MGRGTLLKILLVEDDKIIGDAVRERFDSENHAIEWVLSAEDGYAAQAYNSFDVLILDIRLHKMSGLELLKLLRSEGCSTPALLLTSNSAIGDRVSGLDSGADDYLIKPFEMDELLARTRALFRRAEGRAIPILSVGGLQLDPRLQYISIADRQIELTRHEFMILQCLMERAGRIVSKAQLSDVLYGWDDGAESNTIEVYISQIRRKIGRVRIKTVRGVGYAIE